MDIYEESAGSKGPPQATLVRRAKSYSDFYDVAMTFLSKDVKTETPRDTMDFDQDNSVAVTMTGRYEDMEDEILDQSQEEYRYELH